MLVFYLASPYTDPDPKVKQRRHRIVNYMCYYLMKKGVFVYSPLTHNLPIDQWGFHGNWQTWKDFDHTMVSKCDGLIVLKLPGWEESQGVQAEIEYAKKLGLTIEWIEFDETVLPDDFDTRGSLYDELLTKMLAVYTQREWTPFHSPKNLAMNLGVEVGELMEHFRWLKEEDSYFLSTETQQKVKEELGDVFLTLIHIAHLLKIDLRGAGIDKLENIVEKYPADKCKGSCCKYTAYHTEELKKNNK